jgi:uncharacterized protein (TIGR02118 family)
VIVRVGCAPREASLSFEAFQHHWASEHGALAGSIPGLRSYVQNHAVLSDGRPLLPYVGFDACSELAFDSLEAMDDGFGSQHYRENVTADEHVLIDKSRFGMLLTKRRVLEDAPPGEAKLLTFLRADPNAGAESLAEALAGPYRAAVRGAARHEQLIVIPGAHAGRIQPFADAVDILWFGSADEALGFLSGDAGFAAGYALSGLAAGAQRLLAREVRVVESGVRPQA